jgi:tRNA(Ile2)-agmatinylcytidine synthase
MDDTDSPNGGCTTHIAARLVERFLSVGVRFVDYPNLLRLNPNVPWKTRGNGAICLRVEIDPSSEAVVKKTVLEEVEAFAEFTCGNTNPGVVFLNGGVPEEIIGFSSRVVRSVVTLDEALDLVDGWGGMAVGYKNMRGVIGALAAVGGLQRGDYTYEFLAYRNPQRWGTPREVDPASVRVMDGETEGDTFNNVDPKSARILIAPHGPDPVLFGVRGDDAQAVRRAGLMVSSEPVERWAVFRTNQGTDAHLDVNSAIDTLRPNDPGVVEGQVAGPPRTIQGGHVILRLRDRTAGIDCAAYEPTGGFRDIVRGLIPGDLIRVYGGVRGDAPGEVLTFNLEKLEVLELADDVRLRNPSCPKCGGGMESMGRGKGFRCRKCGFRGRSLSKVEVKEERRIEEGLYITPPGAQRHLTKPLTRYGKERHGPAGPSLIEGWCSALTAK